MSARRASLHRLGVVVSATTTVLSSMVLSGATAAYADTMVTTAAQLESAFAAGGTVVLGSNITIDDGSRPAVGDGEAVTLDLHGQTLTIDNVPRGRAGVAVITGTALTIEDTVGGGEANVTGGPLSAGIGGENGAVDDTGRQDSGTVTILSGTVTAVGNVGAGIGGAAQGSNGTVDIQGGVVSASCGVGDGAGIGGGTNDGAGNGGTILISGGQVTATGGFEGAGIGGGHQGDFGDVTISGGHVVATGGDMGAGIGTGINSIDPVGHLSISGGTVTATGGADAAGIGGGLNTKGDSVDISDGLVTAIGGDHGAGVGTGNSSGGGLSGGTLDVTGGSLTAIGGAQAAGIGGGFDQDGAEVTISAGSVTATGGAGSPDAIGPGDVRNPGSIRDFGTLSNAGLLTFPAGSTESVPAGVTIDSSGTIDLGGSLSGPGTVHNTGRILPTGSGTVDDHGQGDAGRLTVDTHNFALSFDVNGGTSPTPPTQYVYAATVSDANQTLPTASDPQGAFLGWFTAPRGGTQVTTTTDLSAVLGTGPVTATLYAQYDVATHLVVTAQSRILRGHAFSVTILAEDDHGDIATGDNSTLRFASNDPNAVLPPNGSVSLQGGRATVDVTFYRHAGNDAIRVVDAYGNVGQSNPVDVI
ncbi:MAG TPA: hypothetical protein VG708_15785 [Mycobacteriales bacterium]|nr:hypothetical protein [Mycobacteriales bacterium]